MPIIVSCKICGKKFKVKPSIFTRGNVKYCNRKCQAKAYRIIPDRKKCLRCNKIFFVGGGKRKRRDVKFCSRQCASAGAIKPKNMLKGERMWLAGLLDGEGSIIKTGRKLEGTRIVVNNTVKELLDRIKEIAGVGYIYSKIPKNPKHIQTYWWQVCGENARIILKQILPWLIVKREKAKIHLD